MVGGSHLHRIVKHVRPTWPGYIWLSHLKNPQEKTVVLPSLSSSWTTSPLTPDRKEGRFKKQAGRYYSHNCYSLISCDGFWFIEKIGNLLLKTNLILIFPTRIPTFEPLTVVGNASIFRGAGWDPNGGLGGCMLIKWRSNKSSKVDRTIERSFETSPDGEISNWTNSSFKGKCGFIYITLSLWITRCS